MVDEGILDGDIVICEMTATAVNGQIVVALIDQQEVTLKRFHQDDSQITLIPSNHSMQPLSYAAERVTIQGLFIGLLRVQ